MKTSSFPYLRPTWLKNTACAMAMATLVWCSVSPLSANDWVEPMENGQINWQDGFIEATGEGSARFMGNKVQEELMAKQAARTVALSRLLSMTEGVRLTGLTTLGAKAQADTRAATRIKGTVRGAQSVEETVTWFKDESSRRGEVPMAQVTLRLCIDARCSISSTNLSSLTISDSTPSASSVPDQSPASSDPLSALIIDLEKALFLPALSPEIIDENEALIYGAETVSSDIARDTGLVHYVKSVQNAKEMALAGPDPVVLKALKISADNRIVLSNADRDKLKDHPGLKAARVIVALD